MRLAPLDLPYTYPRQSGRGRPTRRSFAVCAGDGVVVTDHVHIVRVGASAIGGILARSAAGDSICISYTRGHIGLRGRHDEPHAVDKIPWPTTSPRWIAPIPMLSYLSAMKGRSLVFRETILCLVQLFVFLIAWPIVQRYGGCNGVIAAAVAAVLCLAGAGLALALGDCLQQPHEAMVSLTIGTMIRMGIPLASGLAIHLCGGPLAEAGLLYYLLMFYPVALAAGTVLSLPVRPPLVPRQETAQDRD